LALRTSFFSRQPGNFLEQDRVPRPRRPRCLPSIHGVGLVGGVQVGGPEELPVALLGELFGGPLEGAFSVPAVVVVFAVVVVVGVVVVADAAVAAVVVVC
jgi:hypothetical protein